MPRPAFANYRSMSEADLRRELRNSEQRIVKAKADIASPTRSDRGRYQLREQTAKIERLNAEIARRATQTPAATATENRGEVIQHG